MKRIIPAKIHGTIKKTKTNQKGFVGGMTVFTGSEGASETAVDGELERTSLM